MLTPVKKSRMTPGLFATKASVSEPRVRLDGGMSIVDPVIAQRLRRTRRPGLVAVVIVLIVILFGGVAVGYGWSSMFGGASLVDAAEYEPSWISVVAIIAGFPLSIIGTIAWLGIVLKRRELGVLYGLATFWTGAGIGLLIAARALGGLVTVIGLISFGLAAVFLAVGAVAAGRRQASRNLQAEIIRTGTRTTATVSDKGYLIFRESPRIFTTVTFTFTDLQGVQRWVQRQMVVHAASPVVDGQETELWYDASDPGNDKKIAVKLAVDSPLR